jgi:3-oxoisoapionate decarboxylase
LPGRPRIGIDAFSLNWQGWTAVETLEYAATLGVENVQFSERGFLDSEDAGYLHDLRARADELHLSIEVGMRSFDRFSSIFDASLGSGEQQLVEMIDVAVACGSPVVRCLLGGAAERLGPPPIDQHIEECLRVLRAVVPYARDHGVKIAVENHGGVDLLARELRDLVEAVGSDSVGVCLDTGNPTYAAEDPLVTAEVLAPYTLTTQVRDTRVWATERGAMVQWVPFGDGNVGIEAVIDYLVAHAPAAPINMEVITGRAPKELQYVDPASEFWRMYPGMLARDFAPFATRAARAVTQPFEQNVLLTGSMMPPADRLEAFRAQQRQHLERSVRWCQAHLSAETDHASRRQMVPPSPSANTRPSET